MIIDAKTFFGICEIARSSGGRADVVGEGEYGDSSHRITLRRAWLYRALAWLWPFATMPLWLAQLALDSVKLGVGTEAVGCR